MAHTDFYSRPTLRSRVPFGRRLRLTALLDLWRSRQALAKLDDAALADVGLTRQEAAKEASKPIWDVPVHWRD